MPREMVKIPVTRDQIQVFNKGSLKARVLFLEGIGIDPDRIIYIDWDALTIQGTSSKPETKPNLGYATTQQLFEELRARAETTTTFQHVREASWLDLTAEMALNFLPVDMLNYRTVDHG